MHNDAVSLEMCGALQDIQISKEGITIVGHSGDTRSTLHIQPDGRILFLFEPHPPKRSKVSLIPSRTQSGCPRKHPEDETVFVQVTTEDPSTFADLTFAETVRYFRLEAHLTQRELARRANYVPETICRIESGARKQTDKNIWRLIRGFGWKQDDPRIPILVSKYEEEEKGEIKEACDS
jgi:DNA-binding XRE family transcriptional regulator